MSARFCLESTRLRMRELSLDDLPFVHSMLGDPEVMRYYPRVLDRDASMAWIERQRARYADEGHGLWLLEERETGTPIGQAGLVMQELRAFPHPRYPEIGWLLHRAFWKRGYATEAATRIRRYAENMLGYPEVISLVRPENEPSQAVARRIGMHVIGETIFASLPHLVFGARRAHLPSPEQAPHE